MDKLPTLSNIGSLQEEMMKINGELTYLESCYICHSNSFKEAQEREMFITKIRETLEKELEIKLIS